MGSGSVEDAGDRRNRNCQTDHQNYPSNQGDDTVMYREIPCYQRVGSQSPSPMKEPPTPKRSPPPVIPPKQCPPTPPIDEPPAPRDPGEPSAPPIGDPPRTTRHGGIHHQSANTKQLLCVTSYCCDGMASWERRLGGSARSQRLGPRHGFLDQVRLSHHK
jgi:hypothetical protein